LGQYSKYWHVFSRYGFLKKRNPDNGLFRSEYRQSRGAYSGKQYTAKAWHTKKHSFLNGRRFRAGLIHPAVPFGHTPEIVSYGGFSW
jgi:hypothetical protein